MRASPSKSPTDLQLVRTFYIDPPTVAHDQRASTHRTRDDSVSRASQRQPISGLLRWRMTNDYERRDVAILRPVSMLRGSGHSTKGLTIISPRPII
jgi:hypothetical protein